MRFWFLIFFVFFLFSCSQDNNFVIEEPDKLDVEEIIKPDTEEITSIEVNDIERIVNLDNNKKKSKELKYYVDYPVFENNTNESIHSYFNDLIQEKEEKLKSLKETEIDTPELHSSFIEYNGLNIKSIVYNIYENLGLAHGLEYTKIFYFNEKGTELKANDMFALKENNKARFKELLLNEVLKSDLIYTNKTEVSNQIDEFLKNMSFYFNSDKIIFIFDPYVIGPYSSGVINISFDIQDIAEYLNKDVVIIPEKKVDLVEDQNLLTLPIKEEEKAYEGVDLNNYIIFDEIEYEEAKKLEKGKKYIALTFDDGPNKANTPLLLDILKENNVKATFFVLGKNANYFPDIIKQIDANGHEIGSHSWDHPQLTRLDENEVKIQVQNTDEVIYNTIGKTPRLFRPPYGEHNNDTDEIIDRTILLRSIDSLDWKNKNVEKNIKNVVDSAKEGSIILMHDIHKTTIDSIDQIIKSLKDKGFEFVTTSELLKHYQTEDYSHKSCFSGFNCK